MLAAEKEARIMATLQEHHPTSLLGDFVKYGGHFDKTDDELEALLDDSSPLLGQICGQAGVPESVVRRNRGLVLQLQSSFRWRILQWTRRSASFFSFVKTLDKNLPEATEEFCHHFMDESRKDCCLEPYFERPTRKRFKRIGAQAAMARDAPFAKAVHWAASSPPLFMNCAQETNHASLSNKLAGAGDWNQGLITPAQLQMLEKWRSQLPLRGAQIEQHVFSQSQNGMMRSVQKNTKKRKIIPSIAKLVDTAPQRSQMTKVAGQRLGGLFVLWRSRDVFVAFEKDLAKRWAQLSDAQKRARAQSSPAICC